MVITNVNQVVYQGDGVTTAFPFTFRIIDATDVKLMLIDADGTETDITSDYFVDTINNTVHYPGYAPGAEPPESEQPAPVQTGQRLVIYRQLPITQEKDLGEKWPFFVIELALDKLTMILQQMFDWWGRSLKISISQKYDNYSTEVPIVKDMALVGGDNGLVAREVMMLGASRWDAEGRAIKNLGSPQENTDAVNKQFLLDNAMLLSATRWDAENRAIKNLGSPQEDTDAVNKLYADYRYLQYRDDIDEGVYNAKSKRIRYVANPTANNDAANKQYVDDSITDYTEATTQLVEEARHYAQEAASYGQRKAYYQNLSELIADTDLYPAQLAQTAGYYSYNDGGGALYRIREKEDNEATDTGSLILLSNGYVAELIVSNETISVKQFGAYGDDTHDDTAFINAAFKYANCITVLIPDGTYLISNYLKPLHPVTIVGFANTKLKGTGTDKYCFLSDGVNNLTFKNISFEYFRRCFEIRNANNICIDNCDASNMYRDAEIFQDNYFVSFVSCSRIEVNNLRWDNTNSNGDCIRFKGNCSNVSVTNVAGVSGDDFIVIVPDEIDDGATPHSFSDAVFCNIITAYNSFRAVRIQTVNTDSYVNNVKFDKCNFEATTTEAVLFCSTGSGGHSPDVSGGSIGNVTFDTCKFKKYDGYAGSNSVIRMNTQKLHGVYFKHSEIISSMAADNCNFFLLEYCNVYGLNISDCIFSDGKSTTLTKPIFADTNCILNSMYIKNIWFTGNVVNNTKTDFLTVNSSGKIYFDGGMLNNVNSIINAADATGNTVINLNSTVGSYVYGVIANSNVQVIGNMPTRASTAGGDVAGTGVKIINGNFLSSLTPSGQPSGVQYLYLDGSTVYPKIKIGSSWKKISMENV